MERRTTAGLIRAVQDILDQAQTPYFSDPQVAEALSDEYMDFLGKIAPWSELGEKERRQLGSLVIRVEPTVTDGKIDLLALDDPAFRILAVLADYSECVKKRPARPLSFDAYAVSLRDPYNKPYDREPAYLDGTDELEILPSPEGVELIYLKRPARIDASKPTAKTEVPYEVQQRLIERAAAKLAIPQDNGSTYQATTAEYNTNENQNS